MSGITDPTEEYFKDGLWGWDKAEEEWVKLSVNASGYLHVIDEGAAGLYNAYAHVSDRKAAATDGGTFTQDAWQTRDINTEDADPSDICSIASNQITLAAGTYRCYIRCPAVGVDEHQTRLYNVTTSTALLLGSSVAGSVSTSSSADSIIAGRFTLATAAALEIQHYCEATNPDDGFGEHSPAGVTNVYTSAEFWRET